jgi:hypothetical protein
MQPSARNAVLDLSRIEPQRQQLPSRNYSMLPPSQLPGLPIPLAVARIRH